MADLDTWFPDDSMQQRFGARLRQHRERQGISLTAIAEQTKINTSLLEGLERDDLARWPTGIFRRAYVRAYGKAIGLDPDQVVREFFERYPEPVVREEPPPVSHPRLRAVVASALGSLSRRPRSVRAPAAEFALNLPPSQPPASPSEAELDLLAAAHICTELGRVEHGNQVLPLLREAARILDARGLVVWVWDAIAAELKPALVHGYPDRVKTTLSGVRRDAANVTAAAFRTAQTCVVNGGDAGSGALVVPMLTAAACAGVLAIELPHGSEKAPGVRAIATFLAAMLAQLVAVAPGGSDVKDVVVRDRRAGSRSDHADPQVAQPSRQGDAVATNGQC